MQDKTADEEEEDSDSDLNEDWENEDSDEELAPDWDKKGAVEEEQGSEASWSVSDGYVFAAMHVLCEIFNAKFVAIGY